MTRNHYALMTYYGIASWGSVIPGTVYAFTCKADRDHWVREADHIPRTNRGARITLGCKSPEVREALRMERECGEGHQAAPVRVTQDKRTA